MADCNEKNEKAPSEIMKKAEEFLASKRKIFLWAMSMTKAPNVS